MRRFPISLLAALLASQVAADSIGGGGVLPTSSVVISGTPTAGQCGQWVNATTLSGVACSTGGAGITGTPVANQLADWASASNVQGITTGTGVVTALGVNTNTNGGFLTMTGAPGTGVQTALTVNTNANGGSVLLNGSPTATDCLQWSASGVQDFGNPCSPSGVISGRLTLTSGVPVLTATVSAATSVIFTPYNGNTIPIWNATLSKFVWAPFSEVSQATTDTTKSPAAVTTNSNYDVFCWSDSGTFRCTHGPAWTSATARGTGVGTTQISDLHSAGIPVNTNAITNGPGAGLGTYVGSFRSNGSSTVDFIEGASASGGTAGVIGIWNQYNRVPVQMTVNDSGTGYTYSLAAIRQARASAGNQVSLISGQAEDAISCKSVRGANSAAVSGAFFQFGFGLDSTTAYALSASAWTFASLHSMAEIDLKPSIAIDLPPQLGWHTISAIENGDGTNATSFDNNSSDFMSVSGRF